MNKRIILYILGWVMVIEGVSMQLSTLVGLWYRESGFLYFLITGLALIALGALFFFKKPKNTTMYLKDGFAATAFAWVLLSVAGAVPLWLSGAIPHYVDALFETISGFTTTGATILTDIEKLQRCMLFWRSFSHFLGGMGVVVFLLAIIPRLGGNQSINLMKAESTGPSVSKSMPKLRTYAFVLYSIYIGLTVIEAVLLMIGGMGTYDAVTTAFSTAGTGGFMVYNDSVGHFHSHYLQAVIAIFMMLFGVNFYIYILILTRKVKQAFKNEELWLYLGIVLAATVTVAINIRTMYPSFFEALHQSFFYITSLSSTTGMVVVDTNRWPEFSKSVIMLVTCIGACAGSTGGGLKVSRLLILLKGIKKEFMIILHPRTIQTVKIDKKKITHEVSRSVSVFFAIYMAIIVVSTILISFNGFDFLTNFSSVLATLNNTGPGLGLVGATENYAKFSLFSKMVFCLNMLAGRLELYPFLLIFLPNMWRRR